MIIPLQRATNNDREPRWRRARSVDEILLVATKAHTIGLNWPEELTGDDGELVSRLWHCVDSCCLRGHVFDIGRNVARGLGLESELGELLDGTLVHPYQNYLIALHPNETTDTDLIYVSLKADLTVAHFRGEIHVDNGERRLALMSLTMVTLVDGAPKLKLWCRAGTFEHRRETTIEDMNDTLDCVYGFLDLLRQSDTKRIPGGATVTVNKRRKLMGRPPLPSYTTVAPSTAYVTALRDRAEAHAALGGTHASPIPHDRRAHARRLRSGKVIMIHASEVLGGAKAAPGRTHYIVPPSTTAGEHE